MAVMTKLLEFYELKNSGIYALSADGAALTYGSKNNVPGIMSLQVTPGDVRTIKMVGDNKVRRIAGRILTYKVRAEHSAINLDALAALTGGTAATSGTTPNGLASFTQKGADEFGYFKLAGLIHKAKDAGTQNGANGVLNLYKGVLTAAPAWSHNDQGVVFTWEAEFIPTEFDDKIWDITAYETATTLA